MEPEMITQLLEKLDAKQYTAILRHLSHNNRKLRIPGFSLMEKAPIKLVANTAKTNKSFRKALYASIAAVILDGAIIDLAKTTDEIKKEIPQVQWLGLAAHLLMVGEEEHAADASKIISDYGSGNNASDSVQPHQSEPESKPDKKEEKFREKYMKAKKENAEMLAELERCKGQLQDAGVEIETLKKSQTDLENQCAAYKAEIDTLSNDRARLIQELDAATKKAEQAQAAPPPRIDIRVLAPNCKDLLDKYSDTILLDFDGTRDMDVMELIQKYDEIWAFSDVVPYGTFRMLKKCKKTADAKVFIFQTAGELVAHAAMVTQAAGRR